jgi:hypothetical protein
MKTSSVRRHFIRGALFSASLLALIAIDRPALAVNTSGYAYGYDATNSYDYQPHGDSGIDSAISSGFTTVTSAHAQSWASAKLIGGVLTKTTGGYGWVDGANPSEYFVWSAFASGTELIVTGPGLNIGDDVNLEFVIPVFDPGADDGRPTFPPESRRPNAIADPPSQVFFTENTFRNDPFFNVTLSLNAGVIQGGAAPQPLFRGEATLQSNGQVLFSDPGNNDFEGLFATEDTFPGGNSIQVATRIPVTVKAGQPFDLLLDLRMSMGDPTGIFDPDPATAEQTPDPGQIFTQYAPDLAALKPVAFGGGSFVVQLRVPNGNPLGYKFAEVPEPGTLSLAIAGLIGLLGCRWRRRRR